MKKTKELRISHGEWAKKTREDPIFAGIKGGIMADILAEMISTEDKAKVSALHDTLRGMERFEQALVYLENDAFKARSEGT